MAPSVMLLGNLRDSNVDMMYAVEMGSGAIIYIPSFINIGSGMEKLLGAGYAYRNTDISVIFLFYFYYCWGGTESLGILFKSLGIY
jgi:hypothetical protein